MRTATCIEMQKLDDGATFYRFELSEPCEFMGAPTTHFDVIKSKKNTQFIGDDRAWVQFITGLFGGGEPRNILSMNYGYEETILSQLRRLRGHWEDIDKKPINRAPYEIARLWDSLDETQHLLVLMMSDYAKEEAQNAVLIASRDDVDNVWDCEND